MEVNIGLDFLAAEQEAEEALKPIPPFDYTFQVEGIEPKLSGLTSKTPGRPYLNWTLSIINSPEYSGKKLFYSTPLPYHNPSSGKLETSGINFLVDMCKALGRPWQGGTFQTELYIGAVGNARVGQRVGQNGRPQNQVDSVF